MSVNIYDGTNLTPIAGKTVPVPTPDYVDIQYNPSTSWIKGMTCISGNKRYRCKVNNTGSAYAPPNTTYWEVLSVSDEIKPAYIYSGRVGTPYGWTQISGGYELTCQCRDMTKYHFVQIDICNQGYLGTNPLFVRASTEVDVDFLRQSVSNSGTNGIQAYDAESNRKLTLEYVSDTSFKLTATSADVWVHVYFK